tara:strand:- start:542 stop:1297 length:756 start_codon:yes stop_codon:yes gene_type:complete
MKTKNIFYALVFLFTILSGCASNDEPITDNIREGDIDIDSPEENTAPSATKTYKILSLGDSYTIGESVCDTCRFPEQLKDSLIQNIDANKTFNLKVIARTGWTTSQLIDAIKNENLSTDYDLTTLLIGVNNEYQNRPFSLYEKEFPELVNTAISKSKGIKSKVIVISIPDYAFTPFGNGDSNISTNIDKYNRFAQNYSIANNITYIYITDITRMGLINTALVASDGLHPSGLAYTKFVERLLPFAIEKLND